MLPLLINTTPTQILLVTLLILLLPARTAGAEISGQARVIDGDSLRIADQEIRLRGIDAPEGQQRCQVKQLDWHCGQAAAETLSYLAAGHTLRCEYSEFDRYDRALAVCYRDTLEINAMMVELGMALAYRHYGNAYNDAEARAREQGNGLWSAQFVPPWKYREQMRARAAAPDDCAVKGNVNSKGEKIFHLPGGRDYARVRIRIEQGDRCFASEAEARAAGFRAPSH